MNHRIVVFSSDYPDPASRTPGDSFVHVRLQEYCKRGFDVRVVGVNRTLANKREYALEGIPVEKCPTRDAAARSIRALSPRLLAIHFFEWWLLGPVIEALRVPTVVWVHGVEALGWYRRLFNLRPVQPFLKYALANARQMYFFRRLVQEANRSGGRTRLVFVSKWMQRVAEMDSLSSVRYAHTIPNPIDIHTFAFREPKPEYRGRILVVRSFDSRKYATDLIAPFVRALAQYPWFRSLEIRIFGDGQYFEHDTRFARQFSNVEVRRGFLSHAAIAEQHRRAGVFFSPTRQDAQGVSMCEAMSSGLVPITTRNTAIPEFVEHGREGFLCDSVAAMASAFCRLFEDAPLFKQMAHAARKRIENTCSIGLVADTEVALLKEMLV